MPKFSLDRWQRLSVQLDDGTVFESVVPVRAFPLSAPDRHISLIDGAGRELLSIEDPTQLADDDRRLLFEELQRREFIPVIEAIHAIAPRSDPSVWHVTTDRGEARFTVTNEDAVRRLHGGGALVVDAHGVRFRVESLDKLDEPSRNLLRRYL
jgi:hypothetical protein